MILITLKCELRLYGQVMRGPQSILPVPVIGIFLAK